MCIVVGNKAKLNKLDCNIQIQINNVTFEQVSKIKYLGVIVDGKEDLSFKEYFNYVMGKGSRRINFLARMGKKC